MDNKKLVTAIALIVVIIWALSMIVDMISATYDPPLGIYPALMIVLGGLFGYRMVKGESEL